MKKITIILIIMMIMFIIIPKNTMATDITYKIGDINNDEVIDSRDTLKILEHIAASTIQKINNLHPDWILNGNQLKAADINEDGVVDSRDTLRELEYIAASTIQKIGNTHPEWKKYIEEKWKIEATGIKLNKTNMTIYKGSTGKISATVVPSNTTNKIIKWSSSNTKVATVDGLGNVKGNSNGIAIITATSSNGKKATCTVTVKIPKAKTVAVSSVTLKQIDRTIAVNTSLQLNAIVQPTNATNKTLTWSSSDNSIAKVDKNGVVKGIKPGKVTITVKTSNNKKATCIIRVNIPAKSISLNKTSTKINKGDTLKLSVSFNPTNTSSKIITWKSSNISVATVNGKGEVKAIAKGTAVITATSIYGKTAKCNISVIENNGINLKHAIKVSAETHSKEHYYLQWHGGTVGSHAGMIGAYVEAINILNNTDYTLKEIYNKIISSHPEQKKKNKPVYENKDINNYYHISVSRASANIKEVKKALAQGKIVADIANTTKWRNEKGNLFGKTGQHTGLIFYYDGKYYHMKTSVKLNAIYTESQLVDWLRDTKDKLIIYSKKD